MNSPKTQEDFIEIGKEIGREEGREIGRGEGIEIGELLGIDKGRREIALQLIKSGDLSVKKIAKATGLSEEIVRALSAEMSATTALQ